MTRRCSKAEGFLPILIGKEHERGIKTTKPKGEENIYINAERDDRGQPQTKKKNPKKNLTQSFFPKKTKKKQKHKQKKKNQKPQRECQIEENPTPQDPSVGGGGGGKSQGGWGVGKK